METPSRYLYKFGLHSKILLFENQKGLVMGTQPLLIKRLLPLGIRKKPVLLCCSKFFYFGYRKTWTSGEDHLFLSPTGLDTINYYFPGVPLRICSWSYTWTSHQRSCKVPHAIFLLFHQGEIASGFYLFAPL